MEDERSIRDSIPREDSYNGLLGIRKGIRGFYSRLPFSVYIDLRGRIEEKINKFNSPMCNEVTISLVGKDNSVKLLPKNECEYAVSNNIKLSDYIFDNYKEAVDFRISNSLGIHDSLTAEPYEVKKPEHFRGEGKRDEVNYDFLENTVVYLIRLMDHLEELYGRSTPTVSGDIRTIKNVLNDLFKKAMSNEDKE